MRMNLKNKEEAKREFGNRLKEYKGKKNCSYRVMAEETGLSSSFISDVANGSYLPSTESVIKLADFLEIDEKELLEGFEYWIRPKGLHFDSMHLTDEDYYNYYTFLSKEKILYKEEKEKVADGIKKDTSGDDSSSKMSKRGIRLYLPGIHTIQDRSLDLLGIPKNATLKTIPPEDPTDVQGNIENDMLYRVEMEKGVFFRKVYKEGDKLILIPYSSDTGFKIMSVDISEIKSIERVTIVEYTTSGSITRKLED
jgi:transcriptional regulator with XRE-family HTH domain